MLIRRLAPKARCAAGGRRRPGVRRGIALAAGSLTVAGLAAAPAGVGATDSSCPAATDLSSLSAGAPLHGLTVSQGTTPERFAGELIGIQKDRIVPGVDLVIVKLRSPAITKAGGVWQGMSGSPAYAADGTLVGAVSWGLTYGPSKIVGLTPAAEMQTMLAATPGTVRPATVPSRIPVSRRLVRAVVRTGAVGPRAAQSGMRPLTVPLAVSGLSSHRIDQLMHRARMQGVRPYTAPSVPASASTGSPIVAGGNLAASIAYGSLSAVAVGTATEVCGAEVLGFGHPIMDIPRGDLTMHNADVLYVQPDSLGQPYKIANLTGPVGALPDNLLPGIHGTMGAPPPATQVESHVDGGGPAATQRYDVHQSPAVHADLCDVQRRLGGGSGAGRGTRFAQVHLAIPTRAAGRYGYLSFNGGDDYYGELPAGATVDHMLRAFTGPRNDQVLTGLTLPGSHGGVRLRSRTRVPATVGGGISLDVQTVG